MNLKAKIQAAASRAASGPGNPKAKKGTPMQPMATKRPTGITQNKPTGLSGANRPSAPASTSSVKTKADYKAERNSMKNEYKNAKYVARQEGKLDRIKSKESGQVGKKIGEGVAAGGAILTLIDQAKKTFAKPTNNTPGQNGG
jgi:hypothetical protein